MSVKTFGRVARATAIAVALVASGLAQAAKYTGTWDPLYGDPFGTMGWRGQATFELTGDCLLSGTGLVASTCLGAAGSTATVVEATVEFYDEADVTKATLATLTWTHPVVAFKSASFVNGVLSAFESDFLDKRADGRMFTIPGGHDFGGSRDPSAYEFYLEFLGTDARLAHLRHVGAPGEPAPRSPDCANNSSNLEMCGYSLPDPDTQARGTLMSFAPLAPIPEPSTYALMLAGLAAVGYVARRRRA